MVSVAIHLICQRLCGRRFIIIIVAQNDELLHLRGGDEGERGRESLSIAVIEVIESCHHR